MEWVALITWVLTAGGGFVLLGLWLKNGGVQQSDESGARIRAARLFSHFGLAAIGLVLWIVYVASDSDALAWIAFALLAVVALLGCSMLAIRLRQRSREPAAAGPAAAAPGGGPGRSCARRRAGGAALPDSDRGRPRRPGCHDARPGVPRGRGRRGVV